MYQTYLSFAPYIKNWYNLRHLSKWNCLWKTKKGRRSCVVYNYTNVYFFLNMFNLSVRPDAKTLLFFLFFKSLNNILEGFNLNSKLFFSHNLSQIANWRTIVRKVNKSISVSNEMMCNSSISEGYILLFILENFGSELLMDIFQLPSKTVYCFTFANSLVKLRWQFSWLLLPVSRFLKSTRDGTCDLKLEVKV